MQELLEDDDVVEVRGWAERRNDNTSGRGRMEAEGNGREVCRRRRHFVWLIEATVAQADDR